MSDIVSPLRGLWQLYILSDIENEFVSQLGIVSESGLADQTVRLTQS